MLVVFRCIDGLFFRPGGCCRSWAAPLLPLGSAGGASGGPSVADLDQKPRDRTPARLLPLLMRRWPCSGRAGAGESCPCSCGCCWGLRALPGDAMLAPLPWLALIRREMYMARWPNASSLWKSERAGVGRRSSSSAQWQVGRLLEEVQVGSRARLDALHEQPRDSGGVCAVTRGEVEPRVAYAADPAVAARMDPGERRAGARSPLAYQ